MTLPRHHLVPPDPGPSLKLPPDWFQGERSLYRILNNPIYLGKITHTRNDKTEVYDAAHEPIVPRALWDQVHRRMERIERETRHRWTHTHLLKGKVRTCEDYAMSPGSVQKVLKRGDPTSGTRLTRYYTSQKAIKQGYDSCPVKSINAGYLDDLVRALVMDHLKSEHGVDLRAEPAEPRDHWIREVIHRVVLAPDRLAIAIERELLPRVVAEIAATKSAIRARPARSGARRAVREGALACPFKPEVDESGPRTVLAVRVAMKRLDGRRVLVSPDGDDLLLTLTANSTPAPKEPLVRAIGRAFAWRREWTKSKESLAEFCRRRGMDYSWTDETLNLIQLSPEILRMALTGGMQRSIRLDDLFAAAKTLDWSKQRELLSIQ
jgi:hypothetical protein